MLEAYSVNAEVAATSPVPFNNVTLKKGCTVTLSGPATIELNKCGVYMVSFDGAAGAETTVQMYKDGVAQPQAQSVGVALGFTTLVQVPNNNCGCPCSSPTTLQFMNETATTFDNVNVVITKIV